MTVAYWLTNQNAMILCQMPSVLLVETVFCFARRFNIMLSDCCLEPVNMVQDANLQVLVQLEKLTGVLSAFDIIFV